MQQDLGKGEAVAMETIKTGAQAIESAHATPFHISLGADLDSDDDDERGDEEEWDEEEIKEHESFKRFLEKEKQKGQHAKKEDSGWLFKSNALKKKQTLRLYLSEEQKNDVILCTIMLYTKIN